MNRFLIVIALCTCLLQIGCKQSELSFFDYENNTYIYFRQIGEEMIEPDTIFYSFSPTNADTSSLLGVGVAYTGLADTVQDRPYLLAIDPLSTAVEGVDYAFLSADSLTMQRGNYQDTLYFKLVNTPALRQNRRFITLRLSGNAFFKIGLQSSFTLGEDGYYDPAVVTIAVDDIWVLPPRWQDNVDFLGRYSREKLEFMIAQLSLDATAFYPEDEFTGYGGAQLGNFAVQAQRVLNQLQAAGNTVYERDGSVMVMGVEAQ